MENYGIKELYDVNIRLNNPTKFNDREYQINETILQFDTAKLAQITEKKSEKQATGGYHNNVLINWEVDKEMSFGILNGVLSPSSWAILSNSKIYNENKKSICFNEMLKPIEDKDYCFVDLKFVPNACPRMGVQGNPFNEPLPMGRRPELELKPLPPSKDKFIFCYDGDTGEKILKYKIYQNRIFFFKSHRKVLIDYTFDYVGKIQEISVGDRLFGGFLNLSGKMSVKNEKSGEVSTAIIEIPKIKISSAMQLNLGRSYDESTVSDFYFTGYPDENIRREKQSVGKITFIDAELTGDYI